MISFLVFLIVPGIYYIVFAFREPPSWFETFVRIPSIFIFFPEKNRVRIGRVTVGVFLILVGIVIAVKVLYPTPLTFPDYRRGRSAAPTKPSAASPSRTTRP